MSASMAVRVLALVLVAVTAAAQGTDIDVVRVRDNVYLLAGPVRNTAVEFGAEGAMVVNTQSADMAPKILASLAQVTSQPIRYIINTNSRADNIGGNVIVTRAGRFIGAQRGETDIAEIIAHENAVNRMTGVTAGEKALPQEAWPTDSYFQDKMDVRFNTEAVQLIYAPAAVTDGDTMVFFRGSDVVCTGDVYTPSAWPFFDATRGGSSQGLIEALNRVIDLAVPDFNEEGGTMIIPGHGRVADESDVVTYRDMLVTVRDRIKELISQRQTLQQVLAAKPTLDFDGIYGAEPGTWTTNQFIEGLYKELSAPHPKRAKTGG